jgi:hypothetical protein
MFLPKKFFFCKVRTVSEETISVKYYEDVIVRGREKVTEKDAPFFSRHVTLRQHEGSSSSGNKKKIWENIKQIPRLLPVSVELGVKKALLL